MNEELILRELRSIKERVCKLDDAIRGNGGGALGRVGLVTRVDRLERSESVRGRLHWFVGLTLLAVLVQGAVPWLKTIWVGGT